MYYLGTYNQVNYYLDKVNTAENYSGNTTTWAKIHKHQSEDLYAIIKHENYEHATMQLVNKLPEGWYPEIQI